MHQDEKELNQKEKETMLKYLLLQTVLLNMFLSFVDANVRPPEELIQIALSYAVKNGFTQEEITALKKTILTLPVKATTIEGNA